MHVSTSRYKTLAVLKCAHTRESVARIALQDEREVRTRDWPRRAHVDLYSQSRAAAPLHCVATLSASSTGAPLTMSLTDPLTLLRDYTMQKKPITLEGDVVVFGRRALPRAAKTAYKNTGAADGTFYQIDSLWSILQGKSVASMRSSAARTASRPSTSRIVRSSSSTCRAPSRTTAPSITLSTCRSSR